jgi:DNA-binding MarR family transcriptional regulator
VNNTVRNIGSVDRLIHEPGRLMLVTLLYVVEAADFLYLLNESGMTKGNLSSHLSKLEEAGYIEIVKGFRGKLPHTVARLTSGGRDAFDRYRTQLKSIATTLDNSLTPRNDPAIDPGPRR